MSALLALPREIRDEIYSYFIPDFPIRHHLRSSTWQELEESDAESCSAATASLFIRPDSARGPESTIFTYQEDLDDEEYLGLQEYLNNEENLDDVEDLNVESCSAAAVSTRAHSDTTRGPGSTIFTDEEDLDEEERQFKAGIRALVLLNKQVHAEYLDALARLAVDVILYLYMENTPERPHEFVLIQEGFQRLGYKRAVQRLIVLARWHAGEHWEKVISSDENWKTKLSFMTGAANVPLSESDSAHVKPTEKPETSSLQNELIDILENKIQSDVVLPDAAWVSIGQEPNVRSFFNVFDQSRGRDTFNINTDRYPYFSEPKRVGRVHAVRDPADLLDASQVVDTLFGEVKRTLRALPSVIELDVTLDVGGATSEDLAVVNIMQPAMALNVKQFIEWKPVLEDGLERIVRVNKRLLAGSYKDLPSGVEEWRKGVMEAECGAMVPREEHRGWWNVMEEQLVPANVRPPPFHTSNKDDLTGL
jgi:hypothetical protein